MQLHSYAVIKAFDSSSQDVSLFVMNISYLWTLIRSRWRLILTMTAVFILLATAYNVIAPKRFVAESSVVIDSREINPVLGVATQTSPMAQATAMVTQVDVIRSERVAREVVADLRLDKDPAVLYRWQQAVDGVGDFKNWAANELVRDLTVRAANDSSIIRIAFASKDPTRAAMFANAFAGAYLKVHVDMRREAARQSSEFFTQKVYDLREAKALAQRRLSEYQKTNGLLELLPDRYDSEATQLNELTAKLAEARSESITQNSKASQSEKVTSDVLQDPVLQRLQGEASGAQVRLDQLQSRLGQQHPEFQRAESELQLLKGAVAERKESVKQSLTRDGVIGQARVSEMGRAVQAQRRRVLDLQSHRDRLTALQGEVDGSGRALELVSARFYQTQMESQSAASNATLLVAAAVPSMPASPKAALNISLGGLAGMLMSIVVVILLDRRNPLLRCPQDITEKLGLPILSSIETLKVRDLQRPAGVRALFGIIATHFR